MPPDVQPLFTQFEKAVHDNISQSRHAKPLELLEEELEDELEELELEEEDIIPDDELDEELLLDELEVLPARKVYVLVLLSIPLAVLTFTNTSTFELVQLVIVGLVNVMEVFVLLNVCKTLLANTTSVTLLKLLPVIVIVWLVLLHGPVPGEI